MPAFESGMRDGQMAAVRRFVEACQADGRIVAAFLGGSYARDAADAYSDLDLYLITTDAAFEAFCVQREAFVHLMGEPILTEHFDIPDMVFFILADGTEGDLSIGRESLFSNTHSGPYKVLVDKTGILAGAVFPDRAADPAEQVETLRRLIYWFWHDLSHFITAMGRDQLWWAQGQLEQLRCYCVSLARLRHDFTDPEAVDEVYFKIEKAMPIEQLAALSGTICALDQAALLAAGSSILQFYQELARPLATSHGLDYPERLEQLMIERLENVRRLSEKNAQVNPPLRPTNHAK